MGKAIQTFADTSGAKAQDTAWFAENLLADDAGKFRIALACNTNCVVQFTINGGTDWIYLNEANALKADAGYVFDIHIRASDEVNLRTPDVTGTNVYYCRLDWVKNEG